MRKSIMFFVFAFMFLFGFNAFSQQYFVYDGETFSVMLTCNNDNSKVLGVQFSSGGKWVDFKIIDFQDLEDTDQGGFLYTVKDGKGKKFTVDYYRDEDYVIVTNVETGDNWTMNRRAEQ